MLFSIVLKTSFNVPLHREEMRCIYDLLCHLMAIFCLCKIVPHRTIAYLTITDSCHYLSSANVDILNDVEVSN
jgi:hypothetical protein